MDGEKIYKNDINRIDEYLKSNNTRILLLYISLSILASISIYFADPDFDYKLLISVIAVGIGIFSSFFMTMLMKKSVIDEYNSIEIFIDKEIIKLTSKRQGKTIKIYNIKSITQDKEKIYIIENNFSRIIIFKYLENLDEFLGLLNEISIIDNKRENYIVQILPIIMYFSQYYLRTFKDLKLLLIYYIVFFCATIISLMNILLGQHKKKYFIFTIVINIYIAIIVGKYLYELMKYFLNK
jgi:hypothetical protein